MVYRDGPRYKAKGARAPPGPKKKNRGLGPPEIFALAPLPLAHHPASSEQSP